MAYRIEYGKDVLNGSRRKRHIFLRNILTLGFLCLFFMLITMMWPEGKTLLRIILIPGDPEVTLEASEIFARNILNGESFRDAVTAFCYTVLNHEPIC